MPAVRDGVQRGAEDARELGGGRDRDRIVLAVEDDRGNPEEAQRRPQVEVAQALPDLLLGTAGNPERSEFSGAPPVVEIAGDRELEHPLTVRLDVALPESAGLDRAPLRLYLGRVVAFGEAPFKLRAGSPPRRRAGHQGQALDPGGVLDGVEQGEEPAP